jgi:hypothetical protein
VTASFSGGAFVPPPRTINDITAILDQERLEDPKGFADARRQADALAPATADRQALAQFYTQRARGAGVIGRIDQQVEDLETANKLEAGPGRQLRVLFELAIAEQGAGHLEAAERHFRAAIANADTGIPRRSGWSSATPTLSSGRHSRWLGMADGDRRAGAWNPATPSRTSRGWCPSRGLILVITE